MPSRSSRREHLLTVFRSLAVERLERLNRDFVQLEQTPDDSELAATVMRDIHSLKGEARMMGFDAINLVSHKAEDLVHFAHKRDFEPLSRISQLVLEGFDLLSLLIQDEPPPDLDPHGYGERVDDLLQELETREAEAPQPDPVPVPPPTQGAQDPEHTEEVPRTTLARREDAFLRVELAKLDRLTELTGDLVLRHGRSERDLLDVASLVEQCSTELDRGRAITDSVRDPDRASRSQLATMVTQLSKVLAETRRLAVRTQDLIAAAREARFDDRLQVDDLDETVRDLRFLPIDSLFAQLPRAARDLAHAQGKTVSVQVTGGAVEVDKAVLDQLADPLLHLVRNCIDHGLESSEDRQAANKPAKGTVALHANQVGSSVDIRVSDDGRGMDLDTIRQTAIERGLLNDEEAEIMDDKKVAELTFLSGFTTREQVTDLSGRGIGLSVVRQQVHSLGGTLGVETTRGQGTTFRLRVPISTVLSPALLVAAGPSFLAIPSDAVQRAIHVLPADVEVTGMGTVFKHEDARIPLADLGILLGGAPAGTSDELMPTVVLHHEGRHLGLRVSRFLGEHRVVQRRLEPFVDGLRLVQGTVSMPGGDLALMLRVSQVMREAMLRSLWRAEAPQGRESRQQTILVVDDSEFTRDMVASLLRDLGYLVVEAVNGHLGLEAVHEHQPDLVLTDLSMPVLDGFGFLEQLRSLSGHGEIPVVVLSTRGSQEDKRRAAELGADAYLVKSDFREDALARTVRRFLHAREE